MYSSAALNGSTLTWRRTSRCGGSQRAESRASATQRGASRTCARARPTAVPLPFPPALQPARRAGLPRLSPSRAQVHSRRFAEQRQAAADRVTQLGEEIHLLLQLPGRARDGEHTVGTEAAGDRDRYPGPNAVVDDVFGQLFHVRARPAYDAV